MEENVKKQAYAVLDKLCKKHKKNKAEHDAYTKCFKLLLTEDGYTEAIEQYFFEGFYCLGAKPLYQYVISRENCIDGFQQIIRGKRFSSSKNSNDPKKRFSFLLEFLYWCFSEKNVKTLLASQVITQITRYAKNARNQYLGSFQSKCWKYFSEPCLKIPGIQFPHMDNLGLSEEIKNEFIYIISMSLEKVNLDMDNINAKRMYQWLGKNIDNSSCGLSQSSSKKYYENESVVNGLETQAQSTNNNQLKNQIENLKKQLADEIRKNKEQERSKIQLEDKNKKQDEQIEFLLGQTKKHEVLENQLLSEIEVMKKKLNEMRQSVQTYKENYTVISGDNEGKFREFKSKLAGSLKNEYADFLEAEDLKMDADLGENMRYQLRSVFDILKKHDIDLK